MNICFCTYELAPKRNACSVIKKLIPSLPLCLSLPLSLSHSLSHTQTQTHTHTHTHTQSHTHRHKHTHTHTIKLILNPFGSNKFPTNGTDSCQSREAFVGKD